MPLLETIAAKSLISLSANITTHLSNRGWNVLLQSFSNAFTESKIRRFCQVCNEYVNMRTLYCPDQDTFIDNVYINLHMAPVGDSTNVFEINESNLQSEGIVNIIGVAGQGKSTFMRKMLLNTIKSGNQIPVFLELKYFEDTPITEQVTNWFNRHEITADEKLIKNLTKQNKIKFLFDGFDEIDPELHEKAVLRIREFSKIYPKCTIIVSSRPYTSITKEPNISNYRIMDLSLEDIDKLFKKISLTDQSKAEEAIQELRKYEYIRNAVSTPILAILLFITYRYWSKVPDNLSDFYRKIFITLLTHHDSIKPGKKINRGIDVPLNDFDIEDVFGVFSFQTFSAHKISFSSREANEHMRKALEHLDFDPSLSEKLIKIIKMNTGILSSDGFDTITFSHKSFQEFYTASFISKQSDINRKSFYEFMSRNSKEAEYRDVLAFLSGLDRKYYGLHYYEPAFKRIFKISNVDPDLNSMNLEKGINTLLNSVRISIKNIDNEHYLPNTIHIDIPDDHPIAMYMKFTNNLVAVFLTSYIDENTNILKLAYLDNTENGEKFLRCIDIVNQYIPQKLGEIKELLNKQFIMTFHSEHEKIINSVRKNNDNLLHEFFIPAKESE